MHTKNVFTLHKQNWPTGVHYSISILGNCFDVVFIIKSKQSQLRQFCGQIVRGEIVGRQSADCLDFHLGTVKFQRVQLNNNNKQYFIYLPEFSAYKSHTPQKVRNRPADAGRVLCGFRPTPSGRHRLAASGRRSTDLLGRGL